MLCGKSHVHAFWLQLLQVSVGGLSHALTPIAAACPELIHVFDAPACFLDALWLPYRRDHADLKAAIGAAGSIDAVFGHADVVTQPCSALFLHDQ